MKNTKVNNVFTVIVLLVFYSCSANMPDLDATDYLEWYGRSERLTLRKKYEHHEFVARYKTPELIYLSENEDHTHVSKKDFLQRKEELGNLSYFNFKIKQESSQDLFVAAGFQDLNYPIDLMQECFYLLQEKDTSRCTLFHFERNYGLSPETNISLAFDTKKIDKAKDFTLVYDDELFNTGLNKFLFRASAINTIPKLRMNDYEN